MDFEQLLCSDENKIKEMSEMATEILREHYDPIVGKTQNDYMLKNFSRQTRSGVSWSRATSIILHMRTEQGSDFSRSIPKPVACI